jgi:hypothetical protein
MTAESKVKFVAKGNCKQCRGRGVIIRTLPRGRKKQVAGKFRCGCVKEVVESAEESNRTQIKADKKEKTNEVIS